MRGKQTEQPSGMVRRGPREQNGMHICGKFWVERDGHTVLSWSRARLLELVGEHGSISVAAKELGLSYPKAWRLIRDMNERLPSPVAATHAGGAAGGATELTEEGKKLVAQFNAVIARFDRWLEDATLKPDA